MSTATTPPTPENVADMLTSGDNDFHDGNHWIPSLCTKGNVVEIGIEPCTETGFALPEVHFRAVVVEGDEMPLVLDWPAELGLSWHDGGDLLTLTDSGIIRLNPRGVDEWDLSPDEALELAAQLAAMATVHKAAFADQAQAQTAGDEQLLDPDCRDGKCGACVGGPCQCSCHQAGGV